MRHAQRVDEQVTIIASILAGASGYVLKQIKGGDIVNAVRMVASGESLFEPALRVRVLNAPRGRAWRVGQDAWLWH